MKKFISILSAIAICSTLTACSSADSANSTEKVIELETAPPDKYTYYLKDYVGRNCASLGQKWQNQMIDYSYGPGCIRLNLVANDGSYVDIDDENELKKYCVTGQSVEPNTVIKLSFKTDENGEELSLVENQTINEIELHVALVE